MPPVQRRNFLPTVIVNIILWITCGLIVLFLNPEKLSKLLIANHQLLFPINIILFFLALTLSLTLTLALLFSNTRRGFFLALFFIGFLILRLTKFASWWNIVLVLAFLILPEIYFSKKTKILK